MARRRRPLRAVSIVFAGFVALVFLSQLSAYYFARAIPRHLLGSEARALLQMQNTSGGLALAAAALGLVFAGAVLLITRERVVADVRVYRATGLPSSSVFVSLLRSHSPAPLGWVLASASVAALADLELGLDTVLPVGLAASFAGMIVLWLAYLASSPLAGGDAGGRSHRAG